MTDHFFSTSLPSGMHRLIFCLCCMLLLMPVAQSLGSSSDDRKTEKVKIDKGIKKYQINIGRLEDGIEKQQEHIETTQQQERELLAELQEIDARLFEQQEKLQVLEDRIGVQGALLISNNLEIERVQLKKQSVQNHLQKRIQAYYKMGNVGFINVAFSTKSLPELLNFHESFEVLITYDQAVIAAYRLTIDELQNSVETLQIEEALLEDFIDQNEREQDKINSFKEEKEALLSRIKTQTQLHERAIAELEQAAKSLTASLKALEKQDEKIDQTFRYSKGKLPPPVSGTLVSGFKEEVMNRLGIKTVSQGIAIKSPNGTIIRAVHQGVVTFSGYLRGYGNTVIVNHGYQYYSICSRIERIFAKKGQKVEEGAEIGIMGDTATLMSEGLYFEIRKDSTPLDPLKWLDKSKLQKENDRKQS
jgi:septal ring factor EnvC (AmiA/AmiB activator)